MFGKSGNKQYGQYVADDVHPKSVDLAVAFGIITEEEGDLIKKAINSSNPRMSKKSKQEK